MASVKEKLLGVVSEDGDGALVCEAPTCGGLLSGTQWCEHIKQAMEMRLDAPLIHFNDDDESGRVWVPLFPSLSLYADVEAIRQSNDALLVAMMDVLPDTPSGANGISLGMILASEGRWDVRLLIIEWLRAAYRQAPACNVRVHRKVPWSARDPRYRDPASLGMVEMANVFSLYRDGNCLDCKEYLDMSLDVPDVDVNGRSPWRK